MQTFKDTGGREWPLSVNFVSVRRVKELIAVDLMEITDGKLAPKILNNPELLINIIYAICKPAVDAAGLTDEQFGTVVVNEALDRATNALLEEITDFFRSSQRTALKAALARVQEAESISLTRSLQKLSKINVEKLLSEAEAEAEAASQAAKSSGQGETGNSPTNSPESAESSLLIQS